MVKIPFVKMQGLGNDFVIIEDQYVKNHGLNYKDLALKICDRRLGVGSDGLIGMIAPCKGSNTDIAWEFYNSDGTIAEMCGNGMRCFAKYVYERNHIKTKDFSVKTLAGIIRPSILDSGEIKVNMGKPIFNPKDIPVNCSKNPCLEQCLSVKNKQFKYNALSMGNPHCIIFSENSYESMKEYGKIIEHNEIFPKKTNVEFVKILSKNEIQVDVWERGCGITQACGTGACASVVAGILNNLTENEVKVKLPGGVLNIKWDGGLDNLKEDVFMTGPAEFVFFGDFLL